MIRSRFSDVTTFKLFSCEQNIARFKSCSCRVVTNICFRVTEESGLYGKKSPIIDLIGRGSGNRQMNLYAKKWCACGGRPRNGKRLLKNPVNKEGRWVCWNLSTRYGNFKETLLLNNDTISADNFVSIFGYNNTSVKVVL